MAREWAEHTGSQETQAFQRVLSQGHKLHMWVCLMGGNVLTAIGLHVYTHVQCLYGTACVPVCEHVWLLCLCYSYG